MDLLARARAWRDADPDLTDRAELSELITRAERGETGPLEDRFTGPLEFGTAGLRGVIGAGESRLNTAVITRATYGLVRHLLATIPGAAERGLVIGRDARRRSEALAQCAAEVAAALGMKVHFLPGTSPTPLVAFAVKELRAAGGATVTASHNPPEYNGFKVYLDRGAQIVPPDDAAIAAQIEAAPPAKDIPRRPLAEALAQGLVVDATRIEESYLAALLELKVLPVPTESLSIVYTALHGVGERLTRQLMAKAGFSRFTSVAAQAQPDGTFPTVSFPNPEEPAALQRVLAQAVREKADLVLAHDPDADRLAVAAFDREGRVTVLTGNELGVLLGYHVLMRDPRPTAERHVITTIVSSAQLLHIARALGVHASETLTGFKWIAKAAVDRAERDGWRFVFGYEEALGYTVGGVTRDKDGLGAALVMAELAADAKSRGETILDVLRRIRETYGLFVGRQRSLTLPGREGADKIKAAMRRLREAQPRTLGGATVEHVWDLAAGTRTHADGRVEPVADFAPSDVLIYTLSGGGRAAVRPSGTEPKIKLYLEVAESLARGEPVDDASVRGGQRIAAIERELLGLGGL